MPRGGYKASGIVRFASTTNYNERKATLSSTHRLASSSSHPHLACAFAMVHNASFSAFMLSGNEDFIRKLSREEICRSMAHVDPSLEISATSSKDTIKACARLLREAGASESRAAKLYSCLKDESLRCEAAESRARSFAEREKLATDRLLVKEASWQRQRGWLLWAVACLLLVVAGPAPAGKLLRGQNEAMYYDVVMALEDTRRVGYRQREAFPPPSREVEAAIAFQVS